MSVNSSKVSALVQALKDVFENKQTNKKDSISGDYSSDSVSYPTVKAVKNFFGTKVTSWSSTTLDTNYPSEKLVKDSLDNKQDTLVSGTTIKTINNESILGSGNITIDTGAIELIKIVQSLPTASSSTMNQLYLIAEATSQTHDAYEVYVTVRTGTSGNYSYAWEKVDTARVDLSGYSLTTHTHGDISSDGKIGSTSGKPIITTTSGKLTTGSFGSTSGTFAEGNHTHSTYRTQAEVDSQIDDALDAITTALSS